MNIFKDLFTEMAATNAAEAAKRKEIQISSDKKIREIRKEKEEFIAALEEQHKEKMAALEEQHKEKMTILEETEEAIKKAKTSEEQLQIINEMINNMY